MFPACWSWRWKQKTKIPSMRRSPNLTGWTRSLASWNSAACFLANMTAPTAIWISRPVPAAPKRKTGPACCCVCICAGQRPKALKPKLLKSQMVKLPGLNPLPSRSSVTTRSAGCVLKPACIAWCAKPVRLRWPSSYLVQLGVYLSGSGRQY